MMWVLSYIGANFALILVVVLLVAALGVVAWVARNWKVAVAAVAVLACGLSYQQIDKTAYQRRVAEEAAQQVAILQGRLDTISEANRANAERALADTARIAELEARADSTPANAAPCLDNEASKRVGDIQ